MIINCPNCNKELELSSEHVGWRVQCPYCAEEFRAMETLARSENGLGADPDEVLSIDWDALETDEDERRKWEERATIWRERIQINCPECEAKVSLETRLFGGRVMCPHCGVAFLARGEGAMVTEDRNRYRDELRREKETEALKQRQNFNGKSRVKEHPAVLRRKEEKDRLFCLIHGDDDERVYSRNDCGFFAYLRKKYENVHIMRILVMNEPPMDAFCKLRGLRDGFGIIVEAKPDEGISELPQGMIDDMEKRFSRKLTLVKKIDGSIVEYCFTLSDSERQISNERNRGMAKKMSSTTQYLGKGTGVDWAKENEAFAKLIAENGISDFRVTAVNPYCMEVSIPLSVDESDVRDFANDLFGELGLLPGGEIDFHQFEPYCFLDMNEYIGFYYVVFNHHSVVGCKAGDAGYKFTVEAVQEGGCEDDDEGPAGDITPEKVMQYLSAAIKSGEIRSKSGEGFFVLKGEFFDAIKDGRKTTEYRDITPRNLSKSIGIKTVKLQHGYGHPGKPPEQMRFEVKSVGFLDADDRECDPYNIPEGFVATTIAIHLGKRIE